MLKQGLLLVLFLSSIGTITVVQAQNQATNAQITEANRGTSKLFTPTLWAQAPDMFACNLTNVSEETHTVRVRIISNGDILNDSGWVAVQPQHTANYTTNGLPSGGPIYCEFTVQGSKAWYRGDAKLFHSGPNTSDFLVIAAQ